MNSDFRDETIKYFEELSEEGTQEYEKQIARYSSKCSDEQCCAVIYDIMDNDTVWGYEAFYVLCTYYRRNKDFYFMNDLIVNHQKFKNHLTFNHIQIQYWVHSESFYDYENLLEIAYNDAQALQKNAGFQQAFCNAFATICEQCDEEDKKRIVSRWYDKAFMCINRAISMDPGYAKFYSTKARILCLNGRYGEAQQLFNRSIAMEDSSRSDYALTIMSYQNYKMAVSFQQQKSNFENEIRILREQLKLVCQNNNKEEKTVWTSEEVYAGEDNYVFISYAHKDKEKVYPLIEDIQKQGVHVWYDTGIIPGEEWPEIIGRRIKNCEVIILMLSFNSILSANVRREITMAISEEKKIIAVMLEDVDLSPGMKLQLGLCQMINVQENQEKLLEKINSTLKKGYNVYESEL